MSASYGELIAALESLPANLRIVASGNGAIPFELLHIVDNTLPAFTLNMLAAHAGLRLREGVTHETSFVGAGMRKSPLSSKIPVKWSMVRHFWSGARDSGSAPRPGDQTSGFWESRAVSALAADSNEYSAARGRATRAAQSTRRATL